jgi:hypothetical protein
MTRFKFYPFIFYECKAKKLYIFKQGCVCQCIILKDAFYVWFEHVLQCDVKVKNYFCVFKTPLIMFLF